MQEEGGKCAVAWIDSGEQLRWPYISISRVAKMTNWMFYGRLNGNAQGVKTNTFLFCVAHQ